MKAFPIRIANIDAKTVNIQRHEVVGYFESFSKVGKFKAINFGDEYETPLYRELKCDNPDCVAVSTAEDGTITAPGNSIMKQKSLETYPTSMNRQHSKSATCSVHSHKCGKVSEARGISPRC